jgi:DNA-binding winged helix-turn-helix (wHTH) protein
VPPRIQFGEYTLDGESRQFWRGEREIHLGPKAFELLQLLLGERPRALSKAAIRDRLWPRTFVSESSLTTVVAELRSALGDPARRPHYVKTIYGFGYAFCGEAGRRETADHRTPFRLLWDEREIPLVAGENVLGRAENAEAGLDAATVSRRHARIVVSASSAVLEDLGSKNGTFLRGTRVRGAAPLCDGDDIRLGRVRLIFRASSRAASTDTEAGD